MTYCSYCLRGGDKYNKKCFKAEEEIKYLKEEKQDKINILNTEKAGNAAIIHAFQAFLKSLCKYHKRFFDKKFGRNSTSFSRVLSTSRLGLSRYKIYKHQEKSKPFF